METSEIEKVAILPDERTAVYPAIKKGMWQHVYRETAGVYWESDLGCFVSTPPQEWTPQKWYQHIIGVVRSGLGLQMILSPDTEFESSDADFEASIKKADQELWR
jgi:hypothetical protein